MAEQFPVQTNTAPTSVESFIADRQSMWARFNKLTLYGSIALAALLVFLAVFVA